VASAFTCGERGVWVARSWQRERRGDVDAATWEGERGTLACSSSRQWVCEGMHPELWRVQHARDRAAPDGRRCAGRACTGRGCDQRAAMSPKEMHNMHRSCFLGSSNGSLSFSSVRQASAASMRNTASALTL